MAARGRESGEGTARALGRAGLAVLGGVLAVLGYAGFEVWPLVFVCFVPALLAVDRAPRRHVMKLALLFGTVTQLGGYYWLMGTLRDFSGFPIPLCLFFYTILCVYQGGKLALAVWLVRRAGDRGWSALLALPAALVGAELVYPLLFPFYMGNALHRVHVLVQIADLGGPLLVSALVALVNAALYVVLRARLERRPFAWPAAVVATSALALTVAYGTVRIRSVDARAAEAPALRVGIVQVNMGIFEKSADSAEGHRRHLEQSEALEAAAAAEGKPLDLVVWPESAFNAFVPEGSSPEVGRYVTGGRVRAPLLFGGLRREGRGSTAHEYNAAFLMGRDGRVLGTYDKTYLLYFGERLPLGETFPSLYDMSPHTGHFTPGSHTRPLTLGDWRLTTLICYEDVLPAFVRRAVRSANPHLLVNLTNDAWFGDSVEPWIHLALAESRAIEHRRYLVRATNSGVSAIIDPVGRVTVHGQVFTRETLVGEVRMMDGETVYGTVGDVVGYVGVVAAAGMALRRRRGAAPAAPSAPPHDAGAPGASGGGV